MWWPLVGVGDIFNDVMASTEVTLVVVEITSWENTCVVYSVCKNLWRAIFWTTSLSNLLPINH